MKNLLNVGFVLLVSGCVTQNSVREAVRKDPSILFDAIQENPEEFLNAMENSQKRMQTNLYRKTLAKELSTSNSNTRTSFTEERILFGSKESPIQLIKYADFQCPACKFGADGLNDAKQEFGSKMAIIHKNVPLEHIHPLAKEAAWIFESLIINNKDIARKFYEKAYALQGQWQTKKELWDLALQLGAQKKWVNKSARTIQERIKNDVIEHSDLGFKGTPAYVINNKTYYGALSGAALKVIIQKELNKK